LALALCCGAASAQQITGTQPNQTITVEGSQLPAPPAKFGGVINDTAVNSKPWWPPRVVPPKGAPNVLLIITDDVGFGAPSTFGGVIPTPALDRIANSGLRYTQFHSTALCSPTRAALITGRNHHSVGFGQVSETSTGFPGYDSVITSAEGTIGAILKDNGYATAWFGKEHNTPTWEASQAGPFDRWPVGMGFEYFYGFVGGDTSQWQPNLFRNTTPIYPYLNNPGWNLTTAMADDAIRYINELNQIAPGKPFLIKYAPGGTHAPHHPTKEWVEKISAMHLFDKGWNALRETIFANQKRLGLIPANTQLTPWPKDLAEWDSLGEIEKKLFIRQADVYGAYLAYTDHEIGRVIQAVEDAGQLENTLIIYISGDNGSSAEGSTVGTPNEVATLNGVTLTPDEQLPWYPFWGSDQTYPHMAVAWSWAFDTPFKWTKQVASHFGGTRQGMAISWPKVIKDKGGIRTQFHHVIDVVPTILEAARIKPPKTLNGIPQKPIEGVSMLYTFDAKNAQAPSARKTQYFEMFANRAIYSEGWVAATTPPAPPWLMGQAKMPGVMDYRWELYDIRNDFSQANDLAAKNPAKLAELQKLFMAEARKYQVLPLDNSVLTRLLAPRPNPMAGKTEFSYTAPVSGVPHGAAPSIIQRSYTITADVTIPEGGAEGMIVTQGGRFGGWGFYLTTGIAGVGKGKPVFLYNLLNIKRTLWVGDELKPGKHTLVFEFKQDGNAFGAGGTGTLSVDGSVVATQKVEHTIPFIFQWDETFDIGIDTGTPVAFIDHEYSLPFRFTGKMHKLTFKLGPTQMPDIARAASR
jgi:arylsulfatase